MTIRDALVQSTLAHLDAQVLLAYILGKDRSWLFAHPEDPLTDEQKQVFTIFSERRSNGEPIAYLIGEKEFYGRPFTVTPATLIPRPSTERLVQSVLDFLKREREIETEVDTNISVLCVPLRPGNPTTLVDIGTGSGAIAVTLALEGCPQTIMAVDISKDALKVANENIEDYDVEIKTILGDGADAIRSIDELFVVVSNPPYIPAGTELERDVKDFEPHQALFSGKDGLDIIRRLIDAALDNPQCVGLCLELRTDQVSTVKDLLQREKL